MLHQLLDEPYISLEDIPDCVWKRNLPILNFNINILVSCFTTDQPDVAPFWHQGELIDSDEKLSPLFSKYAYELEREFLFWIKVFIPTPDPIIMSKFETFTSEQKCENLELKGYLSDRNIIDLAIFYVLVAAVATDEFSEEG